MRLARCSAVLLSLVIALTALGASKTWTGSGGDSLWSNPANWSGGVAPVNGDDLIFGSQSTTNDLTGLSLKSITVTAGSPTLSGNSIQLGSGGLQSIGGSGVTIALDVAVTALQTWSFGSSACSASVALNGTISGSAILFIRGAPGIPANIAVNGHINTTSNELVLGPGTFALNSANAFTGTLLIEGDSSGGACTVATHMPAAVTLNAAGAIPSGIALGLFETLNLNGHDVTLSDLQDNGTVNGPGTMTLTTPGTGTFQGTLQGVTVNVIGGGHAFGSASQSAVFNISGGSLGLENCTFDSSSPVTVTGTGLVLFTNSTAGNLAASSGTVEVAIPSSGSPTLNAVHDVSLASSSTFDVSIVFPGTLPSSPVGPWLTASGTVSLGNSTLSIRSTPVFPAGYRLVLIRNNGGSAVNGTFNGLPEGAVIIVGRPGFPSVAFRISYHGGTSGHDVELTVIQTTSVSLGSSPNPSTSGQTVTLTATVTASGSTPTGTVTFNDGATTLGTVVLSSGVATLPTASLSVGSHTLTATYNGDSGFVGSTSPSVTQVVNSKPVPALVLSASPNPAHARQPVTLTATVTASSGTPTGSVTFFDGSTSLGSATLTAGTASLTTQFTTAGTHNLTAIYSGDASVAGATSSPVAEFVKIGTHTTLSGTPNPAPPGQLVTLTATVHADSGIATGSVSFSEGSTSLGNVVLDASGKAVLTVTPGLGTHGIRATYHAEGDFDPSTSDTLFEVVGDGTPTQTTLTAPPSAVAGAAVALSATVQTASGTPTGTVSFMDGSTVLATVPVGADQTARLTLMDLSEGTHSIVALYLGTSAFDASASPAMAVQVVRSPRRRPARH